VLLLIVGVALRAAAAAEPARDVVVYGATSGGIVAAIQAEALGLERQSATTGKWIMEAWRLITVK
jgi:hypothetical protein